MQGIAVHHKDAEIPHAQLLKDILQV
ncbi:MAG: hypothetical protein ACI4F3_09470 [Enterocloster sp.]